MKFNHYFDQNGIEKKDGEYKINEHKEKGNDGERDGNQQITRSNKIPRKTFDRATVNNIKKLSFEKKKKMFILVDSMIKNITGTAILSDHTGKIRPHLGATSIYMWDYIKVELRHQPDVIVLHCRTNDISNEINTLKRLKTLLKEIEGYDTHKKHQVVISSLIKRYDQDSMKILKALMKKFRVCAHPKVCLLLRVAILINHIWIGVNCTFIEEVRLSWQVTLRNL